MNLYLPQEVVVSLATTTTEPSIRGSATNTTPRSVHDKTFDPQPPDEEEDTAAQVVAVKKSPPISTDCSLGDNNETTEPDHRTKPPPSDSRHNETRKNSDCCQATGSSTNCAFIRQDKSCSAKKRGSNKDAPTIWDGKKIEIFPGVAVPLRGAAETWDAIQRGLVKGVVCLSCSADLYCVKDADSVLCPNCREICPVDLTNKGDEEERAIGGVGLGVNSRRWV